MEYNPTITRRVIAIWHLIAGVAIFVIALVWWPPWLPALGMYLSAFYGVIVVVSAARLWTLAPGAYVLAIAVQCSQVLWVSTPPLQIGATLGPLFGLHLTSTDIGFTAGLNFRAGLLLAPSTIPSGFPLDIALNFLAIMAIAELIRQRRREGPSPLAHAVA